MSSAAMAVDVAIAKDTTATALSLFLGHLRAELTRHYVAKAKYFLSVTRSETDEIKDFEDPIV